MHEWLAEIRLGCRTLTKTPGFTAVAVLSLTLGIGINTAVLAVARAVLLQPLPVAAPERLVTAYWWRSDTVSGLRQMNSGGYKDPSTGRMLSSNYDYGSYTALRDSEAAKADVFAFTFLRQMNVSTDGQPVVGGGMLVSGNYFESMGVPMHLGRGIEPADDRAEAEPAVVLSHGLWQRAFGGDPAVLGRVARVNGRPFTIVGITARGYFGVSNGGFFPPADVSLPLAAQPLVSPRWTPETGTLFEAEEVLWLRIMARLKPGVSRSELQATMSASYAQHLAGSSSDALRAARSPGITLVDGARGLDSMRSSLEKPLLMLAGVAALVFLIACVNVASLVLARGVARQREFWIRLALGAGRARLVRQTLVESVLLASAGGSLGALIAVWAARAMVFTLAGSAPHAIAVELNGWLMLLAAAVSAIAALAFGLFPALKLTSRESADMMRQTGAAAAPQLYAGRLLVLLQVAVSVPLVVGAALFLRTIYNLASVDLGFQPRGVIVFRMDPTLNGYDEPRSRVLFRTLLTRLESVPGVRGVTLLENSLVSGWVSNTSFAAGTSAPKSMLMNRVGPGFFETIGLPLVAGRGIGLQDDDSGTPVGVINEAGAKVFFGSASPLGQQLRMGRVERPIQIVGVARDSKYDSLKKNPQPIIYLPYFQSAGLGAMFVAVKATTDAAMPGRLRAAVAQVDREVPATDMKSQTQVIDETIGGERALTMLLVFFGAFALLLACIGLHGVTAYAVARRTSEIGIRVALGAGRANVLWLVLRQVVVLTVGGLAIGVPAAAVAARAAGAMLYGVTPADPWSISLGAAILFVVALAAGFIPAHRAARLNPLIALRRE
jgi:predicted permease